MELILDKKETVLETYPFNVEKLHFQNPLTRTPLSHPYHRLVLKNWINVLPLTRDGKAVLIKQFRAGSLSSILETPGGEIDHEQEDPLSAAKRELEEETGYVSDDWIPLVSINPNPALQDNTLHCFVAKGCYLAENRRNFPDKNEQIEIELVETKELMTLFLKGRMNHALAGLTLSCAAYQGHLA